jgi:hypothetical protein
MRRFVCACGNALFFDNTQCVACRHDTGWCPVCRSLTALRPNDGGRYRCANPACGALLIKCANYAEHDVCNRCVAADGAAPGALCDYCRFNRTIPDLSVAGNREKWARLEASKRRLLYTLDFLELPYGSAADGFEPPLAFDFKGDVIPAGGRWRGMGRTERVYTGHAGGTITINIREADDAERERLRVRFGETQRTIIGHFRHEIGHYYWEALVRGRHDEAFARVFGDPNQPSYADAQKRYYEAGAPPDWQRRFIRAYASMHPWEDWAESFAFYLDMASVLDTAANMGVTGPVPLGRVEDIADRYSRLGVVVNEMNRDIGLIDLAPEVLTPPVMAKLSFVHERVRGASRGAPATLPTSGETPAHDEAALQTVGRQRVF